MVVICSSSAFGGSIDGDGCTTRQLQYLVMGIVHPLLGSSNAHHNDPVEPGQSGCHPSLDPRWHERMTSHPAHQKMSKIIIPHYVFQPTTMPLASTNLTLFCLTSKVLHAPASAQTNFYTHQPAFTQTLFYTKHFLQKPTFTPTSFYTNPLLHAFTQIRFSTDHLLNQPALTQTSFYTHQLLRKPTFRPTSFYTPFMQTTLYILVQQPALHNPCSGLAECRRLLNYAIFLNRIIPKIRMIPQKRIEKSNVSLFMVWNGLDFTFPLAGCYR